MQHSALIASLVGPLMLVSSVGMWLNRKGFQEAVRGAARNPAVVWAAGVMMMLGGLAVVNFHNEWVADWQVLITLYGWLSLFGGAARMLFPERVAVLGEQMATKQTLMTAGAFISTVIGAILTVKGYQVPIPR